MLELLMSEWEDRLEQEEYEPVHDALRAGIKLLEKYYRRADDTDVYFIAHGMMHTAMSTVSHIRLVLDPVLKLGYLESAWEQEYLDKGMECFKSRVGFLFSMPVGRNLTCMACLFSFLFTKKSMRLLRRNLCRVQRQKDRVCYFTSHQSR